MFDQLQDDLKTLNTVAGRFWKQVPDSAWDKKTGSREQDWTLHQALAHVVSIAQLFNKAALATLRDEVIPTRGYDRREQLADWNASQIERLTYSPPNGLIVQLLQEFRIAHDTIRKITVDNQENKRQVFVYNRPATAIDYMRWQVSHAVVIHGAQVVYPLEREPLWTDFDADFKQGLTGYYLKHWSVAYWQDYGSRDSEAMNFHVDGAGGGEWHILLAPDRGSSDRGAIDNARYNLYFDDVETLYGAFTGYIKIQEALQNGQMRIEGDVPATLKALRYFNPKAPG